nr:S24 family peptidase [Chelonobacter oris]
MEVSEDAFALTIKGDSMLPDFHEDDIVIIDPNVKPLVISELLPSGTPPQSYCYIN